MPAAARILRVNGPGTLVPGPFTLAVLLRWLAGELEGSLCRLAGHLQSGASFASGADRFSPISRTAAATAGATEASKTLGMM